MTVATGLVEELVEKLSEAEHHVKAVRDELDRNLYHLYADGGASVAQLARRTGLSRETIYKSIQRGNDSQQERERLEEMERRQLEWERELEWECERLES